MSWDPNQPPSGPNPYDPSQSTPSGGPNPYDPSQATPPPQNPYAQPFGAPGYQQNTPGYQQNTGYGYTSQAPLPLGQAIQGLPNQYLKILTHPGVQSFAEEQGKADWGSIWIQLLIVGLIGTIIGLLRTAMGTAIMMSTNGGSSAAAYGIITSVFAGGASIFSIVSIIIGFFIIVGIQYLLAKAFKGTGDFKHHAYNYLLFYAPLAIISNILGLIPILGGIIGLGLLVYQIILNVFAVMAAHRLSGGKATMVVLIPIIAVFLVIFLCAIVAVALFFHAASTVPSTYP
jgi:hypothetical protein